MKSNEDEGKGASPNVVYINVNRCQNCRTPAVLSQSQSAASSRLPDTGLRVHGSCRKSFQFSSFSSQHSSSGPMVLLTSTNCEPKRQVFWIGIIMGFRVLYSIDDTYFCLSLATMAVLESSWIHR